MVLADLLSQYGMLFLAILVAGAVAGFAGGLFGIGGGIVMAPVLYATFQSVGIGEAPSLKTAIGTSLAVIIVTSIRSLRTHARGGHVDAAILKAWAPWIALGAATGGFSARWVPVEALTILFIAGAFYFAGRRLFGAEREAAPGRDLTRKTVHIPIGFGTGLFSSLMGLGGGAVGVMVMTWSGRSMHQAIATASGFGVAVAVPGAAGFIVSGLHVSGLPPLSVGFVNLPAFLTMAALAAIAAPIGARMAHRTDATLLSRFFAIYVLIAALGLGADVFI